MNSLESLLDFVLFTHAIRKVKRAMWVKDEEQFENDAEHGYQLALVALYIIETDKLSLDPYKAMGVALVHDIIEVHAGDTPVFGKAEYIASQKEREAEARKLLRKQWPNLKLLHALIDEYEAGQSLESKFVYALDKLLPMLNNYLDNGRNWKRQKVNFNQVIAIKTGKVDSDPTINKYYQKALKLMRKNLGTLFD